MPVSSVQLAVRIDAASIDTEPMATANPMQGNLDDTQDTPPAAHGCETPDTNTMANPSNVGSVVTCIETMLENIVDSLAACQELSITLSRRGHRRSVRGAPTEQIRFPGRTVQEARKFGLSLITTRQLSHDALVSGTILTKRHIYYQHQDLFEKQSQVDDLVDDIAFTIGVDRADLNIVAASKGVLAGPLSIYLKDDSLLDPTSGELGVPIPTIKSISRIDVGSLRWILVIEKDAVFRSLCSSQFWATSNWGPGVILTAKGYPDLITRSFLNMVHATNPQLPLLGLFDFDPDGINILKCYRYGSQKLSHESAARTPAIRWLGIKSDQLFVDRGPRFMGHAHEQRSSQDSQMSNSPHPISKTPISSTTSREPISYLSSGDRHTAETALRILHQRPNHVETNEMTRELQVMLMLGIKAEIEWLDEAGDLCAWLESELCRALS